MASAIRVICLCFVSAGGVWRARRVVFDEVAQAHERPRGDERRLAAVKVKPSPCLSAEPPLRGRRRSTLRRVRGVRGVPRVRRSSSVMVDIARVIVAALRVVPYDANDA